MTAAAFYDGLAPFYHLLYGDWEQSIQRQGKALCELLNEYGVKPGARVHDAAAGIGTQAIGLLQQGYAVSASDISAGAVARLRHELVRRRLEADVAVDDLRVLASVATRSVSAVMACDNSIPHLLSDQEILQAFKQCWRCLEPGGMAVFSVRDYAGMQRKSPEVRPYAMQRDGDTRFVAVQVWEWDADQYDLRIYITTDVRGVCETQILCSRYYAINLDRLLALLKLAGFADVERRDEVLFQPVFYGCKPRS